MGTNMIRSCYSCCIRRSAHNGHGTQGRPQPRLMNGDLLLVLCI